MKKGGAGDRSGASGAKWKHGPPACYGLRRGGRERGERAKERERSGAGGRREE